MIVVGVDVHKHSLTAVPVDEAGRQLDALVTADGEEKVAWSKRPGASPHVGVGGLPAREALTRRRRSLLPGLNL